MVALRPGPAFGGKDRKPNNKDHAQRVQWEGSGAWQSVLVPPKTCLAQSSIKLLTVGGLA